MATRESGARRAKARQTAEATDARIVAVEQELDAWRQRAIPDADAPLEAEDVARLVREFIAAMHIDPAIAQSFTVHTVHYYRRKEILDAPEGRTSAARYTVRHVWQAIGARLAGYLGLVTLAEAREEMQGADEQTLRRFAAARVADARGRQAARQPVALAARPLRPVQHASAVAEPALQAQLSARALTAVVVPLGGEAMCIVPATHASLSSPAAARAMVARLAEALGISLDS